MVIQWAIRWIWRAIRYPAYLNWRYNPLMTEAARRGVRRLGSVPEEELARYTAAEVRELYAFNPFDERFIQENPPSTLETRAFAERMAELVRRRIEDEKRRKDEGDNPES